MVEFHCLLGSHLSEISLSVLTVPSVILPGFHCPTGGTCWSPSSSLVLPHHHCSSGLADNSFLPAWPMSTRLGNAIAMHCSKRHLPPQVQHFSNLKMVETMLILNMGCGEASAKEGKGSFSPHPPPPKSLPLARVQQVEPELKQLRLQCLNLRSTTLPLMVATVDCPTFITPTFITSDIHHPLTEFRHSSPWTFITPYLK